MTMSQRKVLVWGGSSGIGLAAAQAFSISSSQVTISGRSRERGMHALSSLHGRDRGHIFVRSDRLQCDDSDELGEWLSTNVPDIVVNVPPRVVGTGDSSDVSGCIEQGIATHVLASQWLLERIIKRWQSTGFGRFISVTATGAISPGKALYANNICKAALDAWSRSAATTFGAENITFNTIAPGATNTPSLVEWAKASDINATVDTLQIAYTRDTPLGRMLHPAEVAAAAVFLAHDSSCVMNGARLVLDGGKLRL